MANPQLENGHIRIANEIVEHLNRIYLTDGERRCLWVVIRKTYGWNKKEDMISLTQFSKETGLTRPCVCKSIKSLVNKRLLGSKQAFTSDVKTYWFTKDYDEWKVVNKRLPSKQAFTRGSKRQRKKVVNNRALTTITKDTITKDNIKDRRFIPPTLEEVKNYCLERNNNIDPQRFIDYYETNGWFRGKTKIKDWKACVRTWEGNQKETPNIIKQIPSINYDIIIEKKLSKIATKDMIKSLMKEMPDNLWWKVEKFLKSRYREGNPYIEIERELIKEKRQNNERLSSLAKSTGIV